MYLTRFLEVQYRQIRPKLWARPLRWHHNDHDGVSNHQPHHCLLNRLFGHRSKKTSKPRVTGFCAGNSPVNSSHKWPVTRKMFPFDDVIMLRFAIACLHLTPNKSQDIYANACDDMQIRRMKQSLFQLVSRSEFSFHLRLPKIYGACKCIDRTCPVT